ncbi:MAG: signal peptidase I [bacterium]
MKQKRNFKKGFLGISWDLLKVFLSALAVVLVVRYFFIQPFFVKGQSMEPNFHDKEYLIVDEISYRLRKPERGDVIVFKYPRNPSEYYIKRIIGLPNETVNIKEGEVIIFNQENQDGLVLSESYLPNSAYTSGNTYITLGDDEFFVLGDNRNPNGSSDSRHWGLLDKKYIIGRTWLRLWPLNKMDIIKEPSY